jgi:hypothetical protein
MATLAMPMAGRDHACVSVGSNGLVAVGLSAASGFDSAVMTSPRMVAVRSVASVS